MNNLNQNLDIKNTLQTTVFITPQMKQSLAILQMPIVELEQELSNILEENPVLEAVEDDGSDDLYDFDNNESNNLSEDIEDTQDKDKNLDNYYNQVTGMKNAPYTDVIEGRYVARQVDENIPMEIGNKSTYYKVEKGTDINLASTCYK